MSPGALPRGADAIPEQQGAVVLENLHQFQGYRGGKLALEDRQRRVTAEEGGRDRQEQLVDRAGGEQRLVEGRTSLAEHGAHAVALAQGGEDGRRVQLGEAG